MVHLHVAVAIFDEEGRVLLVRQNYRQRLWSLPGGGVDPGESPLDAAVREVAEEAGYRVAIEHLVGVYAAPARHMLSLCFRGSVRESPPWTPTGEIAERVYADADALPEPMSHRMRVRIRDAVAGERGVFRVIDEAPDVDRA